MTDFMAYASACRYSRDEQQVFFSVSTLLPQLLHSSPLPLPSLLQHPSEKEISNMLKRN